jgi:citrate synthase
MSARHSWISAADAAAALDVTRPTLYAYVSRGFVRSQALPGPSRARGYNREDVERLRRRSDERRHPDRAAAHALQWGLPILESSIALIDGQRLYYRGHDAVSLSRTHSIRDVASLIWLGQFGADALAAAPAVPRERLGSDLRTFVARAQALLAAASARDLTAGDMRAPGVARCGWRILHLLTAAAGGGANDSTLDAILAKAWKVSGRGVDVLRAALILCADHELNVSSFTARCVASAGSHPYAVVIAGLAALEGTKHGGASARAEAMLAALRRERRVRGAITARLRRGEPIDGFGHPLYPQGDPRAAALLALLRERYPSSRELAFVVDVAHIASAVLHERPNVDFGLAAVARVLRLPPGAPVSLFAIGRTIGWIGHAIEQYATGQLIRPRAKYVGIAPGISQDAPVKTL